MDRIEFQTLVDEVSRTMQYCQIAMENTALENFLSYFSKEEDDLAADTRQIKVCYYDKGEKKKGVFSVPIASLVSHNKLLLDEVNITVHTNLHFDEGVLYADLNSEGRGDVQDVNNDKSDVNECEVKLTFKNNGPSDGMKETVNMLNKCI